MPARRSPLSIGVVIAMTIAITTACTPTVAQRIEAAAATIAKNLGRDVSKVKSTFRATTLTETDEAFAASLEGIAAKPKWTLKAWTAAEKTVALARTEEVKFVSKVICETLKEWDKQKSVTSAQQSAWAMTLTGLDPSNPSIGHIVAAANSVLASQDQDDVDYVAWLWATTCINDAIPG